MAASREGRFAALAIWAGLTGAAAAPVLIAVGSPYLAYRNLPYVIGGFAGIVCLSLFVVQPLLAAGYLPGLSLPTARRWHRRLGAAIVACVALHVGGLYLTSPPDVMDALLLASPTAFSVYGVIAMWGVAATAVLVALRRRAWMRARWALLHNALALVVVVATVVHALQIEGAMEVVSKWAICIAALAATGATLLDLRVVRPFARRRGVAAGRDARPRSRGEGD